jgi:hypothetical protein
MSTFSSDPKKKELSNHRMQMNDDSFDDDEDIDFDKLYQNAQLTQQLRTQTMDDPKSIKHNITSKNMQTPKTELYQIQGENAILRGQLAKLQKEQGESNSLLKQEFNKLLKDKEDYIKALQENLSKFKSENEFLVSENKNLYQSNSRKRKIRAIDTSETDASTQNANHNISMSTQNTTYTQNISKTSKEDLSTEYPTSNGNINQNDETNIKVVVMNQATFFQDEKTLFIEALTHYIIPGMKKPTLNYLENISSTFDYTHDDFQIFRFENSFKSAILKYLINFQDRNRIDNLLSKFINILLQYIVEIFEQETTHLLSAPYLISLINFSLNYKPKAINEVFIGSTTSKIILLLSKFQELFKPEFDYLSLSGSNNTLEFLTLQDKESNEMVNYEFMEKTMHVKILEVFTAIYLMDLLATLSKLSSFHVFTFDSSKANMIFWKEIPQKLLTNSFLSRKTPVHFIFNTIEILINSITDDDRFAFANIRINSIAKTKLATEISIKILEQIMQFLINLNPNQIHFDIFGLNTCIGSNYHLKLLEIISISTSELSAYPNTNSFDTYEEILKINPNNFQKQENYILKTKLNILNLFESFYSSLIMISLPINTNLKLIRILCQLIGEEQEMIIRSPKSPNNGIKVEIISKSVRIIHYLIAQEGLVKINELPNLTLREMIIVLIRISSNNMKNLSIEYVNKLRKSKFNGVLFNGLQEQEELDKYGLLNSILSIEKLNDEELEKLIENRIQIEIDLYDGIEFNYSDETIDIARDIVSLSVTGDEADRLHDSINFINDNDPEDYAMNDDF